MGEHAVVYGKPGLLAAVNKRIYVTLSKHEGKTPRTHPVEESFIDHAIGTYFRVTGEKNPHTFDVSIASDIMPGYHLGSSAAVAVGIAGALYYALHHILDLSTINSIAYEIEKKQHGNPSGGDNTAVTYGGLVWYRKESEALKIFQKIPFSFPSSFSHFFLIDTGKPKETTGEMVAIVAARVKRQGTRMERLFERNEARTRQLLAAIHDSDETMFIDALKRGEETLEKIGVVSQKVISLIREIEKGNGAAKILGGGGRRGGVGYVLGYHRERRIIEAIGKKYRYSVHGIQLGEEGLRVEHHT